MKWIVKLLMRLGVMSYFTPDDIINAEVEDACREHSEVVRTVRAAGISQQRNNAALKQVLADVRGKSNMLMDVDHPSHPH